MAYKDMTDDERAFAEEFNRGDEPLNDPEEIAEQVTDAETAPSRESSGDEGEPPAVAIVVADGEELREGAEQVAADVTSEAAAQAPGQEQTQNEEQLDPKEEQRRRSWEGRLRAREEELARREAALKNAKPSDESAKQASEAIEQAADNLEQSGDTQGAQRASDLAEKVESGEISAQEAMATLSNDFGDDFVKMIAAIAANEARAAGRQIAESTTGELRKSVEELITDIVDDKQRSHFETIAEAHPDFNDIAQTPEFAEFSKSYPDGQQIAEAGSARQIVKMLNEFKKTLNKDTEPENPAVAAAEGVRSAGIRIPQQPTKADGYEDAWDQF